jgi:hypothetical protein
MIKLAAMFFDYVPMVHNDNPMGICPDQHSQLFQLTSAVQSGFEVRRIGSASRQLSPHYFVEFERKETVLVNRNSCGVQEDIAILV